MIHLGNNWLQILILTLTPLQHRQEPIALINQNLVIINSWLSHLSKLGNLITSLDQTEKLLGNPTLLMRCKLSEMTQRLLNFFDVGLLLGILGIQGSSLGDVDSVLGQIFLCDLLDLLESFLWSEFWLVKLHFVILNYYAR